jgi:hypothetical protein
MAWSARLRGGGLSWHSWPWEHVQHLCAGFGIDLHTWLPVHIEPGSELGIWDTWCAQGR